MLSNAKGGYDLHSHTSASDGLLRPKETVALALQAGLAGLAITDHDTVAGVQEALSAGIAHGIDVIAGVEISTTADGEDIHVLGLWIDPEDETLMARLSSNRDVRRRRNQAMIQSLRKLGFQVTLEEAERIAAERRGGKDRSVSRPHIAELLVRKGFVSSVKEAFDSYLGNGCPAYISIDRIPPEEAIRWIHDAGGAAVIAHPGLYKHADGLIKRLAASGMDGVEAAHADHDAEQENHYRALASQCGLIATAGSDFHGIRDGVPFHAMLGSKAVDSHTMQALQSIRERKREK
jgi:predicted metal-dependent phosphoesterase TrpH